MLAGKQLGISVMRLSRFIWGKLWVKDLRRDQHFIFFVSRRYQEYMVSSACCGDNILYPTYTYVDQDLSNLNKWIDKTSTYWNLSIPEWFAFFLDGISFVISCVRVSVRRGTWDWEDGTFWWKVHESHELMINWKFRACWCLPYFSTPSERRCTRGSGWTLFIYYSYIQNDTTN